MSDIREEALMIDHLIERVESAGGPDRELDAAIALDLCLCSRYRNWYDDPETKTLHAWHMQVIGDHPRFTKWVPLPELTASLDAVVALIEAKMPDVSWSCGQPHKPYKAEATIYGPLKPWPESTRCEFGYHSKAATPTLALLASFLRAWKEQNNE